VIGPIDTSPLLADTPLLALVLGGETVLVARAASVHEGPAVPRAAVEVPEERVVGAAALHQGLQAPAPRRCT